MRLLVLGGSVFLSREVARAAVARGHTVTCAHRGRSGPTPDGAEYVALDRVTDADPATGPWATLARTSWDAVVDVTGRPSWVRTALGALSDHAAHWTFVSTINVYADVSRPGGSPADTALVLPPGPDEGEGGDLDPSSGAEAYGRNKVGCEQLVRAAMGAGALVIRPGLIVGPGDPSGRFTYWPVRMARGGRVLAPAPGSGLVQVVDVRDLATWIVESAESGTTGDVDGVGPPVPRKQLLREVAAGVGADVELVWADAADLELLEVGPWHGPRSLPLWVPDPELAGMLARDVTASLGAGLRCRPVADTARDTLEWVERTDDAVVTGLTEQEEADVLAALALRPRSRVVARGPGPGRCARPDRDAARCGDHRSPGRGGPGM